MRLRDSALSPAQMRSGPDEAALHAGEAPPTSTDAPIGAVRIARTWKQYALAVLLTAAALLLGHVIYDPGESTHFVFFFAAVLLSGWYGGAWPALLSTALVTVFTIFSLTHPQLSTIREVVPITVFVSIAGLSAWLSEIRLRSNAVQKVLLERERAARLAAARRADEVAALNRELEVHVRRRTAALASTVKELEAFSYSVSHDLRAPLRSLDGFSQALLEDYENVLDDEGRQYLHRIRANSQKMGALIDAMLQLSRVTRKNLGHEDVDVSAIAGEIVQELRSREPERHVSTEIRPGMHEQGDASLIRIALANLIGNAWKFTRKCSEARIEIGCLDKNGHPAYFVKDNGAGFEMKYATKLFTAFERLHHEYEFEGTGIGLATVQRIIHKHGGQLWAEGEVGKGATFYFTLNEKGLHE